MGTPHTTEDHIHPHNAAHPAHNHAANDHDHAHAPAHPSPAMDASKLNHTPAPLPISEAAPRSPPLRDANSMFSNPFSGESAYLDNEPQHPTVAETGSLGTSPIQGPGPRMGQLKRRESEPMPQRRIIRLASFGGEGLVAKPAGPCPGESEEEVIV